VFQLQPARIMEKNVGRYRGLGIEFMAEKRPEFGGRSQRMKSHI